MKEPPKLVVSYAWSWFWKAYLLVYRYPGESPDSSWFGYARPEDLIE